MRTTLVENGIAVLRPSHQELLEVVNHVLGKNTFDQSVAYNVNTDWENRSVTVVVRNKSTGNEEFVWFDNAVEWPEKFKVGLAKAKKKVLGRY